MERFLRCPLPPFHGDAQYSDPKSSLSSQNSLPSIPSLTPNTAAAKASHHCIATLTGHSSHIFSLTLAGKHLYCGDSNGQIRIWNRTHTDQNRTVVDGRSAVKSIVVSGDILVTAHNDYKIRVWKIDNESHKYKMITSLPTMADRCAHLFSAKHYVEIRRHKRRTWVHHVDAVSGLALSKDASLLYSVSWDRTLKLWRTSDLKCVESVQNAHDDAINAVVLSPDGVVYTGSADKKIKAWRKEIDVVSRKYKHCLISTLEKHKSAVNALAINDDGSILYSGACDRSIIVWEKDGSGDGHMRVAGALRGHTKAILCLSVVSELVCSGSADKTVRVWRKGNAKNINYSCLGVFEGHNNPVKCLTACLDTFRHKNSDDELGNSYLVYSGGLDSVIKVWKIRVPDL